MLPSTPVPAEQDEEDAAAADPESPVLMTCAATGYQEGQDPLSSLAPGGRSVPSVTRTRTLSTSLSTTLTLTQALFLNLGVLESHRADLNLVPFTSQRRTLHLRAR